VNRLRDLLGHHVRESIALDPSARPEWAAGLRVATAMAVPLIVGWALHRPEFLWCGLGGWLAMLAVAAAAALGAALLRPRS
jgi:uncharacterized membrane protein YccC